MSDEPSALPAPIDRYLAAYNARDVDAMLATLTDDIVFENVSNSGSSVRLTGRAELEAMARQTAAVMSARRQTVIEVVSAPPRCALQIDYEATISVDLPNGWKQGQVIRLRGASFFELRGELICRIVDLS